MMPIDTVISELLLDQPRALKLKIMSIISTFFFSTDFFKIDFKCVFYKAGFKSTNIFDIEIISVPFKI